MNRRGFVKAFASVPMLGLLMPASARAAELDLRPEIESFFEWTHPVRGDWYRCATGEQYETLAIAAKTPEAAARMLVDAFRVMAQHTALIKPQGAPICFADERPRYLYWRRYPEVARYEWMPESASDVDGWRSKPPMWQATARAVISLEKCGESQSAVSAHAESMRQIQNRLIRGWEHRV